MLVLSRQRDEEVVITVPPSAEPTQIVMTIVDIRGDKVRTGWEAPRHVAVHRREVDEKIARKAKGLTLATALEKVKHKGTR